MAAIADGPTDVMRNLVHDRTVRVAEREVAASDENADVDVDPDDVVGFVSFDARDDVVHVTQIDGTAEACERLLGEPVGFAEHERMRVELLVTDSEGDVAAAAERVGFERDGAGPRFDGERTVRYRLTPT